MEFRRARLHEPVDEGLLAHHERTIFPLLHRRASFAGADGFRLYDVVDRRRHGRTRTSSPTPTSGPDGERSLVLFNNRYGEAARLDPRVGRVQRPRPRRRAADASRDDRRRARAERRHRTGSSCLRDAMTGREGLRSSAEVVRDGFRVDLGAYECRVYVDLGELADGPRPVGHAGRATRSRDRAHPIDEALLLPRARAGARRAPGAPSAAALAAVRAGRGARAPTRARAPAASCGARPDPGGRSRRPRRRAVRRTTPVADRPRRARRRRACPTTAGARRTRSSEGWSSPTPGCVVSMTARSPAGSPTRRLRDALGVHDADGIAWFDRDGVRAPRGDRRDAGEPARWRVRDPRREPCPGPVGPRQHPNGRRPGEAEGTAGRLAAAAAAARLSRGRLPREPRAGRRPRHPGRRRRLDAGMTRLRWLTIVLAVALVGVIELLSDTAPRPVPAVPRATRSW